MEEKVMVSDYLADLNAGLSTIATAIAQTEEEALYNKLKSLRDTDEERQRQIYKIAKSKGYYTPAAPATTQEISNVKSDVMKG